MRGISATPGKPRLISLFTVAVILSLTMHLGALLLALAAPRLFPGPLRLPEVYQVKLYSAEPTAATGASRTLATEPPPADQPPPAMVVRPPAPASRALPKPPAIPAAKSVAKPTSKPPEVSLSPLKERLLKEARERQAQANRERQLAERLAAVKRDLRAQEAEAQAQKAISKAREAIAATYRTGVKQPAAGQSPGPAKPGSSAAGAVSLGEPDGAAVAEALAAYVARLRARIAPHWKLIEHQEWDRKLSAAMSIRIRKDGSLLSPPGMVRYSGNSRFDQQVRKAVNASLPLPPLPAELGKSQEEIVVTFTPGGLK